MTEQTKERNARKVRTGIVTSDKMEKTVVVVVESTTRHPLYHKIMRRTKRYLAHDDRFESKPGDLVRIMATSPISRNKHWRVAEILRRGEVAEIAPRDIDKEYLGTKREKATDEASAAAEQTPTQPATKIPEPPSAEATETEAAADTAPGADVPADEASSATTDADADADTDESVSATADEDQKDSDQ